MALNYVLAGAALLLVPCVTISVGCLWEHCVRNDEERWLDEYFARGGGADRDETLGPLEGDEGVVRLGSAGGGVDDDVDGVVEDGFGVWLREHGLDVGGAEHGLEGFERQA